LEHGVLIKMTNRKIKNHNHFFVLDEYIEMNVDKIEQIHNNPDELLGLSTGFSELDRIFLGLEDSNLIVLASGSQMGKSSLALRIARNVAIEEHTPVAFFSLKMTAEQLAMRLLLSEANIDLNQLIHTRPSPKEWRKLTDAAARLEGKPFFIEDKLDFSLKGIHRKANYLKKSLGIGLLIIDYIQLLTTTDDCSEERQITRTAIFFKTLARELNIPVIVVSQMSGLIDDLCCDWTSMLKASTETSALFQHADIMAFIHRDNVTNQMTSCYEKEIVKVIVAKNRYGNIGTACLSFLRQYAKFEQ